MQVNLSGHHVDDHPAAAELRREEDCAHPAALRPRHRRALHADGREAAAQGRVDVRLSGTTVHAATVARRHVRRHRRCWPTSSTSRCAGTRKSTATRRRRDTVTEPEFRPDGEPGSGDNPDWQAFCAGVVTSMRLIVVSGLSGSGKSVALDMLEDLDYLLRRQHPGRPAAGIHRLHGPHQRVHLPPDGRRRRRAQPPRGSRGGAAAGRDAAQAAASRCETLFLRAESETLLKRFSETRRRHPLSRHGVGLQEALEQEAAPARAARQRGRPDDRHLAAVGARTARTDPRTRGRPREVRAIAAVPVVRLSARRARRCGLRVRRARAAEPVLGPGAARADRARRAGRAVPRQARPK